MSLIESITRTFTLDAINEQLTAIEAPNVDKANKDLGAVLIIKSINGKEAAVRTFWDLYLGKGNVEDIQALLELAYPGCSDKSAAGQLCRFRNPDKYRPKSMPRYEVTGGRGGRVSNVNINIGDDIMARLTALVNNTKKKDTDN